MSEITTLKPIALNRMTSEILGGIRAVLSDIDDTMTTDGLLPSHAYHALERLSNAGKIVIPVTGRPAGWCDMIARFWPVHGVVGENGAFYFRYDHESRKMIRRYWKSDDERSEDRQKLDALGRKILESVPGSAIASDQAYREADLAIDFCEDVEPLSADAVDNIVALFDEAGAHAKISSIHVNGWFGDYDKLTMTNAILSEQFDIFLPNDIESIAYIGDSPNDSPMFEKFPNSIGVANVAEYANRMPTMPTYIANGRGGAGFAEFADRLLNCCQINDRNS